MINIYSIVVVVSSDAMRFGGFHESLILDKGLLSKLIHLLVIQVAACDSSTHIISAEGKGDLHAENTSGCGYSSPVCHPIHVPGFLSAITPEFGGYTFGVTPVLHLLSDLSYN